MHGLKINAFSGEKMPAHVPGEKNAAEIRMNSFEKGDTLAAAISGMLALILLIGVPLLAAMMLVYFFFVR